MDRHEKVKGNIVADISDRELNIILSEIRDTKGPNIIVTLDCCYSAGATRGAESGGKNRSIRAIPDKLYLELMLRAADDDKRRNAGSMKAYSEGWHPDMSSHVLIAACQSHEQAFEIWQSAPNRQYHGRLTLALDSAWKSRERWSNETYGGLEQVLMDSLRDVQLPKVLGDRKGLRVWFRPFQ